MTARDLCYNANSLLVYRKNITYTGSIITAAAIIITTTPPDMFFCLQTQKAYETVLIDTHIINNNAAILPNVNTT